jgi:hypothetical protein
MKKIVLLSLIAVTVISAGFTTVQLMDGCDKRALTENCKKKLDDFKYDSQKYSKINYLDHDQKLEIEVPVFIGEKYRMIFNTSYLPKGIVISVYTKSKDSKKREAIYTTKNEAEGTKVYVFDAPHVRNMYVDYDVPTDASNPKLSGCVVFMVGYK